jgi:non-ribosomal peptide synthetase component F
LIAAGVRPGEVVGCRADRSLEMVVRTLAILKAGATCLPLDLQQPVLRLREMLRQASVRYCLGTISDEPCPGVELLSCSHRAAREYPAA